jgi:NADPH-dependent glutamate synthase beta subunit-like oxidoreductase
VALNDMAWTLATWGIEGEELTNVYQATEYLVRGNLPLERALPT